MKIKYNLNPSIQRHFHFYTLLQKTEQRFTFVCGTLFHQNIVTFQYKSPLRIHTIIHIFTTNCEHSPRLLVK